MSLEQTELVSAKDFIVVSIPDRDSMSLERAKDSLKSSSARVSIPDRDSMSLEQKIQTENPCY